MSTIKGTTSTCYVPTSTASNIPTSTFAPCSVTPTAVTATSGTSTYTPNAPTSSTTKNTSSSNAPKPPKVEHTKDNIITTFYNKDGSYRVETKDKKNNAITEVSEYTSAGIMQKKIVYDKPLLSQKYYKAEEVIYDKSGKIQQKTNYDKNGNLECIEKYKNGNLVSRTKYYDKKINGVQVIKSVETYDEKNSKLTGSESYYQNGYKQSIEEYNNGKLMTKTQYYNEKKNGVQLTESIQTYDKTSTIITSSTKYDTSSRLIEEKKYSNGKLNETTMYTYSGSGTDNYTRSETNASGHTFRVTTSSKSGNIITLTVKDINKDKSYKIATKNAKNSYNDKVEYYNASGVIQQKSTRTSNGAYKTVYYDSKGKEKKDYKNLNWKNKLKYQAITKIGKSTLATTAILTLMKSVGINLGGFCTAQLLSLSLGGFDPLLATKKNVNELSEPEKSAWAERINNCSDITSVGYSGEDFTLYEFKKNSVLAGTLKANQDLKNKIKDMLKKNISSGTINFGSSSNVDLKNGIGQMKIDNVTKNSDGTVTVKCSDIYDFPQYGVCGKSADLNAIGALGIRLGVIKPYAWSVSFTYSAAEIA